MEVEDTIKSIKLAINERLSGPAIPSFSISWLLWNYKFVMIMLSENTITTTLQLIEKHSFFGTFDIILKGFFLPGITAAAYIFLYPYPERFINKIWRTHQMKLLEQRRQIEDEVLLTLEESRQFRSALRQQSSEHAEDIMVKNEEIAELKSEISNLTKQIRETAKNFPLSSNSSMPDITDEEMDVLKLFANIKQDIKESDIIENTGLNAVRIQYLLGQLEQKQLITVSYPPYGKSYSLTQEGRTCLVLKGII